METAGTPRTIVVGVDDSPESDRALEWARVVAGPDDAIVMLHSWQLPVIAGYDMVVTVDPTEVESYAKQGMAERAERVDDPRLVPVVQQGHPGRTLVAEADERDAGMIVVGHRGHSRAALVLGSTANHVVHHTTRPVVVVRGEPAPPSVRRVVVGVDAHSDASDGADDNASVRALRFVYQLPGVEHIRVVHAWFLPSLTVGMFADPAGSNDALDAAAQAVVDRAVAAAGPPPAGVELVAEPLRGTPGFALIEASHDADLVAIGSRGRGGFAGLVLGSTSLEITAHSHCPVVVVR